MHVFVNLKLVVLFQSTEIYIMEKKYGTNKNQHTF